MINPLDLSSSPQSLSEIKNKDPEGPQRFSSVIVPAQVFVWISNFDRLVIETVCENILGLKNQRSKGTVEI
jgi:hypothetical protein